MAKRTAPFKNRTFDLKTGVFDFLKKAPKTSVLLGKIRLDWKEMVGDLISAHSIPSNIRSNTLTVTVDDPIWTSELAMYKDEIRDKIHAQFPTTAKWMTGIRFAVGKLNAPEEHTEAAPQLTIDSETLKIIDEKVSVIGDSELKEALRGYLIQSSLKQKKQE